MHRSFIGGISLVILTAGLAVAVNLYPHRQVFGQVRGDGIPASASASAPAPLGVLLTEAERTWLREHPVIRVVQDPAWPPVEFMDPQGESSGISGDYLRLIEQRLGIRFERVRGLDWQEAHARLKRFDIDMTTCVAETPARREYWVFTQPYLKIPIVIVARESVTYIGQMSELAGKKVAVVDGYIAVEHIASDFPEIQLVKVKTVREGLGLLERDEVFAFVDNMLVIGYQMAQLKLANLKIAGETPYVNAQCMAVRKDWAVLAGIVQKGLDSITESERAAIYEKWVPVRYEHGFDYGRFWQALGVFAVIVAAMGFWIAKLTKEIRGRKAAVEALRESEARYRSLFEAAHDAIFLMAGDRFIDCNLRTLTMLRGRREQIVGTHPYEHSPEFQPDGRSSAEKAREMVSAAQNGAPQFFEWRHHRLDGSPFDAEVALNPVSIAGKPHLLAIVRDITERKRAEEEIRRLNAELEQRVQDRTARLAAANTALDEFAHVVSHDLKAPLRAVSQLAHWIAQDYAAVLDGDGKSKLDLMISRVARMYSLIDGVLKYSRLGRVVEDRRPVDLHELVPEVIESLSPPAHIRVSVEGRLPVINADRTRMAQLFQNLIGNAIKYMDKPEGVVTVGCADGDGWWRFHVADNGPGIEAKYHEKVFGIFQTLVSRDRKESTGIGLAVVRKIVEAYGGEIKLESEVGKGCTFLFTLPK